MPLDVENQRRIDARVSRRDNRERDIIKALQDGATIKDVTKKFKASNTLVCHLNRIRKTEDDYEDVAPDVDSTGLSAREIIEQALPDAARTLVKHMRCGKNVRTRVKLALEILKAGGLYDNDKSGQFVINIQQAQITKMRKGAEGLTYVDRNGRKLLMSGEPAEPDEVVSA